MLLYNYHGVTGVFTGSTEALPDPLELELARAAVFDPLARAAEQARDQGALDALNRFESATADPGLPIEAFDEARAVFELATSALNQAYHNAIADARLQASKVKPLHWLIPANTTTIKPPEFDWDEVAVFQNGAWSVRRDADGDGQPDDVIAPDPAASIRLERNRRIGLVRWLVDRHRDELALGRATTLTGEDYLIVLQHIQDLRDVPQQDGFPSHVVWPTPYSQWG